jgi:predicted dienelactone hydrolase
MAIPVFAAVCTVRILLLAGEGKRRVVRPHHYCRISSSPYAVKARICTLRRNPIAAPAATLDNLHVLTNEEIVMRMRVMMGAFAAALSISVAAQAAEAVQAGFRMTTIAAAEPIPVALFYPSSAPSRTIAMGPFSPTVAINGAPSESIKGLILMSHGSGGSELGHYNLAQKLAQHGYLVAALQHPRDNWRNRTLVASAAFFSERPKQVSRVLDALLADPQWKDKITPGAIGAIGHSAGGFTVLALAGGVADPRRLVRHCGPGTDDPVFCGLGGKRPDNGAAQATPPIRLEDFQVADRRIRAVIAMAPIGFVFTPESLSEIDVPVRIYSAQHDALLSDKYHGGWLHARMPQAGFEQVNNAGHFAFMMKLNQEGSGDALDPNGDPPGFDRAAFQARLANEVVEHFDKYLR